MALRIPPLRLARREPTEKAASLEADAVPVAPSVGGGMIEAAKVNCAFCWIATLTAS